MDAHGSAAPVLAQAWEGFHEAQREVLGWMTGSERFERFAQSRARAYHAAIEATAMAYNFAVAPRRLHPRMFVNTVWQTDMYTLGQNGPDFYYGVCFLDGEQEYRITGNFNDSVLILGQVIAHLSGHPESDVVGNYDFADFEVGHDGSYEIAVSAQEKPGNWMKLSPDSGYNFILFRRATGDWNQTPASLHIERTSPLPDDHYDDDEFDEATMAERIDRATAFMKYLVRDFAINLYEWYRGNAAEDEQGGETRTKVMARNDSDAGFNRLCFLPGTITSTVGSPASNYAMAIYNLAPDEALIVELDEVPDGVYWSYQLGDVWSRSLNYMYHNSSISMHHAAVDGDGALRVVVAHRDPGVQNWLDTTGRLQGSLVFRNYRATKAPVPSTRVVKFDEIADHLPPGTATVSAEERAAQLRSRHAGVLKLHGE
ncbi:hypothetical protein GCM10011371_13340 [Novosphingobium marinum]|uniref:DUF1214 domain-containing protein n=1 Tax=Novosphingobium marinum TaxID=1514948 RepID=A0A7Y9XVS3_9SPHN|nr:DUF1214 domain-containing protein [Novosphingobium marinum]NYH95442.1 hypothetical protein [Novosphingobium marinum]GGC27102.1 hypothetical protein GCM10011371_13340 [Novosphingobium marinum]